MAHGLRLLSFACTRCGECCRKFRVPLTGADLARLGGATGRDAADLVDWLAPDAVDMTGEPETFVLLPEGRRLLVLGWRDGGCQLLAGEACSVHPARPTSCALYPFDVRLGARGGIRRLALLDTSGCPYETGPRAHPRTVATLAARHTSELQSYARFVQAFNRVQRHRQRAGLLLKTGSDFLDALRVQTLRVRPERAVFQGPASGASPLASAASALASVAPESTTPASTEPGSGTPASGTAASGPPASGTAASSVGSGGPASVGPGTPASPELGVLPSGSTPKINSPER